MAQATRFLRKKLLDLANGKAAWTNTAVYFGVSQSDPTVDGLLTGEPSGAGYARIALTANMSLTDNDGKASNTTAMAFATPSGAWGTGAMAFWFTADAASAGNVLLFGPLPSPFIVNSGDPLPIPVGNIAFSLGV